MKPPRLAVRISSLACCCVFACSGPTETTNRVPPEEPPPVRPPMGGTGGDEGPAGNTSPPPAAPRLPPAPNVDAIFETGCATSTIQSQLLPSNLLFVLDRSSSMACNPPPTTDSASCEADPVRADPGTLSKWEITLEALSGSITGLPDETVVGLSYFSNDDACGVHASPSVSLAPLDEAQRSALQASLGSVQPSGATPLVGATILAYRHMHEEALAGRIRGNKFVVLLTDGQQSEACSDPTRCADPTACTELLVQQEVPRAAGKGVSIKTFVIGVPGSEPALSVLSEIALRGGTAPPDCDVAAGGCHFDMTTQANLAAALEEALASIAGSALTCELPIPRQEGVEFDAERVNVVFSPEDQSEPYVIPQDDRAPCDAGADGWQYTEDQGKIRLCGAACGLVRNRRGARLDVVLGCPVRGPD